jgi:hypothetical protein
MDYQSLSYVPRSFQDIRLDIGHVTAMEYKGVSKKQIISLGLRQRAINFDEMTIETLRTKEELSNRSPWPSTAAALLDVQPPLETLAYEERDRHGVQFRYFSVSRQDEQKQSTRSHVHLRIGPASVDVQYAIKDQIPAIIREARITLFGRRYRGQDASK